MEFSISWTTISAGSDLQKGVLVESWAMSFLVLFRSMGCDRKKSSEVEKPTVRQGF